MHTVAVMYRKCVDVVVALAIAAVGVFAITAPPSHGQPGDEIAATDTAPPGGTSSISLRELGIVSPLAFYGETSSQRLTLPVPPGLTPIALNTTVELPINFQSGLLTVMQGDRILGRVDLPPANLVPVEIPLGGAAVIDGSVTVSVHTYLLPLDRQCFRAESPLRLIDGSVSFAGVEQPPATVAAFLPPVLRQLTIFLPQSPSPAESEAAIQLASSATVNYGGHAPQIVVVPLPNAQAIPPGPPQPLERQVVIKEGPNDGLSVQGAPEAPWLLISGPLGQASKPDIDLLFDDLSPLALSPKAVVDSLDPTEQFPSDTTTLRDLGQPSLSATALEPQVSIGLDQTRFGRSIHDVRLQLEGSYTPMPPDIGGQITVSIGEEIIDHWPADNTGNIDRSVTVPDRLLDRYTLIRVALNEAGNAGRCGDFYTFDPGDRVPTLTIDGDSQVQSSPAKPPVPAGFQSLPQALMPQLTVGIKPRSLPDTIRAVNVVVGLQKRTSNTPIDVVVKSVQEAIDSSNPALVIAAEGWNNSNIVLPVAASDTGPITFNANESGGDPTVVTLDPALRFASLQTVFDNGRTMLIATSNGPAAQLDELFGWLNGEPQRWQNLRGIAVVSVAGHDPVTINPPSYSSASVAASESDSDARPGWLWWLGAGSVAALVIAAAALIVARRRRAR
ncbi:hypothetical protein H7J93_24640 [Mycobacterium barrassiae]|uniref:hypothetical protein n=1 Tax=Mycobacterium barrassiae TaxID=319709 RepID=UPI0035591E3A|nr:hypothetical protein [Mycobacterium barrassiae]